MFLEFKHIYKIQRTVRFLLAVTLSSCVLTLSTFSYFSTACKHTDESVFFLIVVSQSLYVIKVSTWAGSLKQTPSPCQFSRLSLIFFWIRFASGKIRMSKLSKD